ncbi:MAG: exonuclease [Desulfococcus sp. 4484_241]|nr:MAG: exonuclease [Desulfococcus sp. 4484_241]
MKLAFYGATGEVTGSMHMISSEADNVLLDCGLFQGRRADVAKKNRDVPFDSADITNIVLSHAHIDHSGRIPLLSRNGFAGRVVTTRATKDACEYMLRDAAHIQESDADYLNYKAVRAALHRQAGETGKGGHHGANHVRKLLKLDRHRLNNEKVRELAQKFSVPLVDPLYSDADAVAALSAFEGVPYRTPITIGRDMTVTFYEAGHILGSAVSIITCRENGSVKRVCYTGDLGRFGKVIIKDPNLDFAPEDREIDLLVIESTYGSREHEPVHDLSGRVKQVLNDAFDRGGSVLIPAFAYGRTQEILYSIHELYDSGEVRKVPVYVDSPLAINLTKVFGEHPEAYNGEAQETFLKRGENPFIFRNVHFTPSVEESMEIMRDDRPHIVISASGMCEFGRILHHLRYKIHNPANTILIVGYMAEHTLGRRILEQGMAYQETGGKGEPPVMRILGKEYPLMARVERIEGFSAHADKHELLRFVKESNLVVRRAAVVHGEKEQAACFADTLRKEGINAVVPVHGQKIAV